MAVATLERPDGSRSASIRASPASWQSLAAPLRSLWPFRLIGEPQMDEDQRLRAGEVLYYGADREGAYLKAIELRPGHFAFRYLGELPEDMAIEL